MSSASTPIPSRIAMLLLLVAALYLAAPLPVLAIPPASEAKAKAQGPQMGMLSIAARGQETAIGVGYSRAEERLLGSICLNEDLVAQYTRSLGGGRARIEAQESLVTQSIFGELSGGMTSRARFGATSVGASGQFMKRESSDELSIAQTFLFELTYPPQTFAPPVMRPGGILTDGAAELLKVDPTGFIAQCGEGIVTSIQSGVRLYSLLRVSFVTTEAREQFAASVSIKGGWGEVAANIASLKESVKRQGRIEFTAVQEGGDFKALGDIFGSDTSDGQAAPSEYHIECSLVNPESCLTQIGRVIDYGRVQFGKLPEPGTPSPLGAVHVSYTIRPWRDFGIAAARDLDVETLSRLLRDLVDLYDDEQRRLNVLEGLLGRPSVLCREANDQREAWRTEAEDRQREIRMVAELCYEAPLDTCVERVTELRERRQHQNVPPSVAVLPEGCMTPSAQSDCQVWLSEGAKGNTFGHPVCLVCAGTVASYSSGALVVQPPAYGGGGLSSIRDRLVPGAVCPNMPPNVNVVVSAGGSVGATDDRASAGWSADLRWALVALNTQSQQVGTDVAGGIGAPVSAGSGAKAEVSSDRLRFQTRVPSDGFIAAAVQPNTWTMFLELSPARMVDMAARFGGDFKVQVRASELIHALGLEDDVTRELEAHGP